jgi:hypothetical protein
MQFFGVMVVSPTLDPTTGDYTLTIDRFATVAPSCYILLAMVVMTLVTFKTKKQLDAKDTRKAIQAGHSLIDTNAKLFLDSQYMLKFKRLFDFSFWIFIFAYMFALPSIINMFMMCCIVFAEMLILWEH